jgi:hypothetical protein
MQSIVHQDSFAKKLGTAREAQDALLAAGGFLGSTTESVCR